MREPERIDRILEKIGRLWHLFPDQRLGQLIDNYVIPTGKAADVTHPLRNQEDDQTEVLLDRQLEDQAELESYFIRDPDRVRRILESHGYDVKAPDDDTPPG